MMFLFNDAVSGLSSDGPDAGNAYTCSDAVGPVSSSRETGSLVSICYIPSKRNLKLT
jgi:hypothetical protein